MHVAIQKKLNIKLVYHCSIVFHFFQEPFKAKYVIQEYENKGVNRSDYLFSHLELPEFFLKNTYKF